MIGTGSVGFAGLIGRGAARVVSDPIEPQYINDQPYIEIDMGVEGKRFPEIRTGLMALFGRDVVMDRRSLVGFLRDISLVSDDEYASFKPPVELSVFATKRNDLRDYPELEYSGIYEDGWVSESSYYRLSQPPKSSSFDMVIRGEVPKIPGGDAYFETKAALQVDGKVVAEQVLQLGRFELRGPVTPATGINPARHVLLHFTRVQQLPPVGDLPDGRPVAARLTYVGFQAAPQPSTPVAATAR